MAIFKTSLISLLPVFHIDEAICITVFWGNLLIILKDIASNSSYVYSGISKIVNLLSRGLLSRSMLFDVANITMLAFTIYACYYLNVIDSIIMAKRNYALC